MSLIKKQVFVTTWTKQQQIWTDIHWFALNKFMICKHIVNINKHKPHETYWCFWQTVVFVNTADMFAFLVFVQWKSIGINPALGLLCLYCSKDLFFHKRQQPRPTSTKILSCQNVWSSCLFDTFDVWSLFDKAVPGSLTFANLFVFHFFPFPAWFQRCSLGVAKKHTF